MKRLGATSGDKEFCEEERGGASQMERKQHELERVKVTKPSKRA